MLTGPALARFRKNLLAWFSQSQRDLPWRHSKDPYRIWLSEIMLQQTRVAAAMPYYERFLERFPDVVALAEAPQEEVLRHWSGLGYYSRARNLHKAAQQIVALHKGVFPATEVEALALPGIGKYTGAAILSIAYGQKLAVLDGNVARVLARLQAIRGDLRAGKRWQELQKSAEALLSPGAPGDWNQAMMELGAILCTPKSPQCLLCPVNEFCQARKLGLADAIPEKRKQRAKVELQLAAAVLVDPQGHTLLLPPPKPRAGPGHKAVVEALVSRMWHFPTVEVRSNAPSDLREYFQESVPGGRKFSGRFELLRKVRHAVTYRSITLFPFRVHLKKLPRISGARFLPLSNISSVPISNLTRKIARAALGS
ncbi:MAG TPA: A/G-specific adenine glycosylase [Verrucomicrobiae bacterium]|nr:A/G-specific adenine glycosylase [Verrucomicrobiae bacterium]